MVSKLDKYALVDLDKRFKDTVYAVQANHDEQFLLWLDNDNMSKGWHIVDKQYALKWEQDTGIGRHIGSIGVRPIYAGIMWAKLNGNLVAFYELTSQLCDYELLDKWADKAFELDTKLGKDGRRRHCDVANFNHCRRYILDYGK